RAAASGLSDTMTPGNIASLIKSDAVALRVRLEGERPPYSRLHWRGPAMTDFDGRTWRMQGSGMLGSLKFAYAANPVRYAITLEPRNKNRLLALDAPASAPPGTYPLVDLQLRSYRPLDQRMRYELTSYLDYRYEQG